ncbi:MAG: Unknown protein [uncultured Sulfurovum sp.]|uniref:Uncharacterized protein n=1 Tax=uncultured Sulfurovum sp. TaxID=269237 RepID=A0A6S6U196_9BACT|nr:MAG: Unknown protein [uncultured Sulfurovum sp.]
MKLPDDDTLYKIFMFVMFGSVILGLLFDTEY